MQPDKAFVLGPGIDKLLAFMVGFLGTLLVSILLIVGAYYWAGQVQGELAEARRAHARSIAVWTLVGSVGVPLVLAVLVLGFTILAGNAINGIMQNFTDGMKNAAMQ